MNMQSFVDEYLKIAASKKEAPYQQSRAGRRPIRAHNLLKKAEAPPALAAKGIKDLLARFGKGVWANKKPLGLLGAGAVGAKAGEELLLEPWSYGMRAREMGAAY